MFAFNITLLENAVNDLIERTLGKNSKHFNVTIDITLGKNCYNVSHQQ